VALGLAALGAVVATTAGATARVAGAAAAALRVLSWDIRNADAIESALVVEAPIMASSLRRSIMREAIWSRIAIALSELIVIRGLE
jgi:hypothetical protein